MSDTKPGQSQSTQKSIDEISADIESLRRKSLQFVDSISRFFVDKREILNLMMLSAISQEPLLIVGPPGTAKSDLVLKFRDALGISDEDYFEYMLTRFSEPSEIIGPVDINRLRDGEYVRRSEGKLPTARLAFLDEIFKSNSAILNILLTIINERKFYQDGRPVPVELRILFAATNEIPMHDDLRALNDRFTLKVISRPVQESRFTELIDLGLASDVDRSQGRKPWKEGLLTLQDILDLNTYVNHVFGQSATAAEGDSLNDRERFFPAPVFAEFQRLVRTLAHEDRIFISDRRIVKLYKLLRIQAWLKRGGTVETSDLAMLAFVGNTQEELAILQERIPVLLNLAN